MAGERVEDLLRHAAIHAVSAGAHLQGQKVPAPAQVHDVGSLPAIRLLTRPLVALRLQVLRHVERITHHKVMSTSHKAAGAASCCTSSKCLNSENAPGVLYRLNHTYTVTRVIMGDGSIGGKEPETKTCM